MHIETLEGRVLPSTTPLLPPASPRGVAAANINVSRTAGNQSEGTIAVNPADPDRVFTASNTRDDGLFAAYTTDRGRTWAGRTIADGASDNLEFACCDPSAAWDAHGNLYLAYLNFGGDKVVIVLSTDGGRTFDTLKEFGGDVDQPTIAVGDDSVWVTFQFNERIVASGARVTGPGQVGRFSAVQKAPGSSDGNFGDIAVGPDGQVLVTYQGPIDNDEINKLYVNLDPDGLGPRGFRNAVYVATTRVTGFYDIPAQTGRDIDAEVGLAYDRSAGDHRGRAYMIYTDVPGRRKADTDVFLRFSDNDGKTWSRRQRVNDDAGFNSQFLPRMAIDQTTGNVGVIWHDARLDTGVYGVPGNSDRTANNDAMLFGVVGVPADAGVTFAANRQISSRPSSASRAGSDVDYGDYTGLAFNAGILWPAWADNSNSTKNNPSGRYRAFDLYTAKIRTSAFSASL